MPTLRRFSFASLLGSLSLALTACSTVMLEAPVTESGVPEAPVTTSTNASRAVGDVCALDAQCASRRCSADADAGSCGVCLDARKLGESCDGPLQVCSASAACGDGVCRSTKKIVGDACELGPKGGDLGSCDDELYCAGQPGDQQGTCATYVPVGGACQSFTGYCVEGAVCMDSGVCAILPAGSCRYDEDCGAAEFCAGTGLCQTATLTEGAACGLVNGTFIDDDCVPGTVCGNLEFPNGGGGQGTLWTCVALPVEGDPCVTGACAEGLFCASYFDGELPLCQRRGSVGATCGDNAAWIDDCAPGLECRGEVCELACD